MSRKKSIRKAQTPEHRAFLLLVGLHPGKDVIERLDRSRDIWALVQHDALGSLGHRCVSDLGA